MKYVVVFPGVFTRHYRAWKIINHVNDIAAAAKRFHENARDPVTLAVNLKSISLEGLNDGDIDSLDAL